MAPKKHKMDADSAPDEGVELYFTLIQERQRFQEIYWQTGDQKVLVEVEKVRERIRGVMRSIGIDDQCINP